MRGRRAYLIPPPKVAIGTHWLILVRRAKPLSGWNADSVPAPRKTRRPPPAALMIRQRHYIDTVRREVGHIDDTARFVEGDVRCVPADRHHGAERGPAHSRRQGGSRRKNNACQPTGPFLA